MWLVIVPWGIVAATTAGVARLLPDEYKSTAKIQIVPPKVPNEIYKPPTTTNMTDRIRATQEIILSRTRLERLVKEFNLYQDRQKSSIMEDIVTDMRRDIAVNPGKGDVFTVTYTGDNPVTVLKVTEKIAGFFIDESLRQSVLRAEGTSAFVEGQAEDKERQLREIEDRLTKYRMTYAGELPETVGPNTNAIQNLQNQLGSSSVQQMSDLNRRKDLENRIEELEKVDTSAASTGVPLMPSDPQSNSPAAKRLAAAEAAFNAIVAQGLKPNHFKYIDAERELKNAQKAAAAEGLRTAPVGPGAVAANPLEARRLQQLETWRAELKTLNAQMEAREANDKLIKAKIVDYQAKIDRAPLRAAELTQLQRDYNTLSGIYQGFVGKREAAQSAVDLERRQIGEQFNLLDAAQLPQKPSAPDRLVINIFGLAAGLAFGVALVVLLEYRDSSFKNDTELGGVIGLPVLAVVPLMQSDSERRAQFRKRLIMNLGCASTAAVCFAVVAYAFVFLK
jgi:polysaccharide chain length determinant protein (PEP-CTERM system associated)